MTTRLLHLEISEPISPVNEPSPFEEDSTFLTGKRPDVASVFSAFFGDGPFEFPLPSDSSSESLSQIPVNLPPPRCDDSISATDAIKTDISGIEALRREFLFKDTYKCLDCNERGFAAYARDGDLACAYVEFQRGMLGTGESAYSKLLTQYFNECLSSFCRHENIEENIDKFKDYISEIRKNVINPEYNAMRLLLSDLVRESKKRGDLSEAIRFQKEAIFFIMLEDTENDFLGRRPPGDYRLPVERRVAKGMRELQKLMKT
jgi:hypothetical protein